ncbi:MAG: isoprenylcysteine carboxylmethyltransferase family protein [Clostridia bacterium]|nr:isoprenylcysteine carboxylmethyltransferase family protein [Clostridia bacterium]
MKKTLFIQAIAKYLSGLLLVALLLFLPAGTLRWPRGWLFMGILFVPMLGAGVVMMLKNPDLLRRRLNARERELDQKQNIALSGGMFIAGFILAGLDFRFGWLQLPAWASVCAALFFLLGYALFGEVLRENEYLSRTVEVTAGQRVIDTGLYGVVRHPMYAATVIMFLMMPLALGSLIALVPFLAYPALIARRIHGEEAVLERELPHYTDYERRVKYRLMPRVW